MNKINYNSVIFDLDGTLLNTLADLCDAVNSFTKVYGYPAASLEDTRKRVGNGIGNLVARSVPEGKENPNYNKCFELFKNFYTENMTAKTVPYEGIIPLLTVLNKKGIKTAVLSNKADYAVKLLCKKYFKNLIPVCVGEKEGVPRKPAPDGVFNVMKELGATPETTLYVGDSDVDIFTAHNSGLKCAAVTWGFREKELLINSRADFLADNCRELLEIICR